jgi:hypothetical protein
MAYPMSYRFRCQEGRRCGMIACTRDRLCLTRATARLPGVSRLSTTPNGRHNHRGLAPATFQAPGACHMSSRVRRSSPTTGLGQATLLTSQRADGGFGKDNGAERLGTAPTDPRAAPADLLRLLIFQKPPPSGWTTLRPIPRCWRTRNSGSC